MESLKVQFKIGRTSYSISKVGDKVTYWVLNHSKKLGRHVASKVEDAATIKVMERKYNNILKAVKG